MRENSTLTIHGYYIRDSELAILFRIHKIRETEITPIEQWFPKSQVIKSFKVPISAKLDAQNNSWLLVSEWIMNQKGLPLNPTCQKEYNVPYNSPNLPTKSETHLKDHFDSYDSIDPDDIPF